MNLPDDGRITPDSAGLSGSPPPGRSGKGRISAPTSPEMGGFSGLAPVSSSDWVREAVGRMTSDPGVGLEWGEAVWRNPETGRDERAVTLGGRYLMTCPACLPGECGHAMGMEYVPGLRPAPVSAATDGGAGVDLSDWPAAPADVRAGELVKALRLGWQPLPLPAGKKTPPPAGFTGWEGKMVTETLIARWSAMPEYGWRQWAARMNPLPFACPECGGADARPVGVDIDAYKPEAEGRDIVAETGSALGLPDGFPPTWTTTARSAPSGIRHYLVCGQRIPPGGLPANPTDCSEIIQHFHRYAVMPGSEHPASGGRYRLYDPEGKPADRLPPVTGLPALLVSLPAAPPPGDVQTSDTRNGRAGGDTGGWAAAADRFSQTFSPEDVLGGEYIGRKGPPGWPHHYAHPDSGGGGKAYAANPDRTRVMIFSRTLADRLGAETWTDGRPHPETGRKQPATYDLADLAARKQGIARQAVLRPYKNGVPAPPPEADGAESRRGVFSLGLILTYGTQILRNGQFVDIFRPNKPPLKYDEYTYRDVDYSDYVDFYNQQALVLTAPFQIIPAPELPRFVADQPPELHVRTETGADVTLGEPGEITLYYGATNTGKTWAAVWTLKQLGEDYPALYIATEQLPAVAERLTGQNITWTALAGQPASGTDHADLARLADETNARIIVIDCLSPLLEDENSAAAYHAAIAQFQPLLQTRYSIIVHHSGKNPRSGARGTSRITDKPPIVYEIQRPASAASGDRLLHITPRKLKNRWEGIGAQLRVTDHWEIIASAIPSEGETIPSELPHGRIADLWRKHGGKPLTKNRIANDIIAPAVSCGKTKAATIVNNLIANDYLTLTGETPQSYPLYKLAKQ